MLQYKIHNIYFKCTCVNLEHSSSVIYFSYYAKDFASTSYYFIRTIPHINQMWCNTSNISTSKQQFAQMKFKWNTHISYRRMFSHTIKVTMLLLDSLVCWKWLGNSIKKLSVYSDVCIGWCECFNKSDILLMV